MDVTSEPWFAWTFAVIVGLPLLTLGLSEVHLRLVRRRSALAKPVNRLRVWLVPMVALFILLTRAGDLSRDNNGVRVVATFVGLIAVSVALGLLNAVLFAQAREGTWRARLPSIFVDLARLAVIVTAAAIVASFVWGLDVGGLVAALGVGSIIIGLALQNAIGSVVSGLLLLFEQPFTLGDTLNVAGTTGRVVEMNWRATHLDTGSGIQIIPNATIAGASFANLSRPTPEHDLVVEASFAAGDVPHHVMGVLYDVAIDVPYLRPRGVPSVAARGGGKYAVVLPLSTAGDSGDAQSQFTTWLWYAARRAGLTLDGAAPAADTAEDVRVAVDRSLATLGLTEDELASLAGQARLTVFAPGETVVAPGEVPEALRYVVSGVVVEQLPTADGSVVEVAEHDVGEAISVEAVLREPATTRSVARGVVELLELPAAAVDQMVATHAEVARRLNALVDLHATQRSAAFAQLRR